MLSSSVAGVPRQRRLVPRAYVRNAPAAPQRRATVSVIIPCYNYGHFLPESIGSALSQTDVDLEVIVVDDASTDDSAAVAARFAEQDPRVRLLRHETNTNHVVAFNDGYEMATGEFIVRLDADDLLTPGALARAVAVFEAFPEVGLVYGHPRHFTTPVPPEPVLGPSRSWSVWSGAEWLAERCRRGYNVITTPEAVVRASVMREIGPLNVKLRFAQDMEMWFRTAAVSDVARINGPDQALHRDHDASMSVNAGSGFLLDAQERHRVFQILFEGVGGRLPQAPRLHELANRAIAGQALEEACRIYDRRRFRQQDVDDLVAFALEAYPKAAELPQWRAFLRRQRIGPALTPFTPIAVGGVVRRRFQHYRRRLEWVRSGQ